MDGGAVVCLVGYPLASPLAAGAVIRFAGNADELDFQSEGPRAHVYASVRKRPRDVEIRVTRAVGDECDVELSSSQGTSTTTTRGQSPTASPAAAP